MSNEEYIQNLQDRRIHLSRQIEVHATIGQMGIVEKLKEERDKIEALLPKPEKHVPWQLCPMCNGQKQVSIIGTGSTSPFEACGICGGTGIIQMAKVQS